MGVVYEAYDRERETSVALKTLRHLDPEHLYRFKNEFRAMADVEHPNLVRLGELVCSDDRWFFTMELIEGVDFLTWVRANSMAPLGNDAGLLDTMNSGPLEPAILPRATLPGKRGGRALGTPPLNQPAPSPAAPDVLFTALIDERRLREALAQMAAALGALHAAGKVHRDIKPSNVLVTPQGRLVLLDFGVIVDAHVDDVSTGTTLVGTPAYMAPDQAASRPVGPEADWYSVGSMLYEALTGRLPFSGTPLQILMQKQASEPPPPRSLVAGVPDDLDALCVDLLRTDPRDRPSQDQIVLRLERRSSGEPHQRVERSSSQSFGGPTLVGRREELAVLRAAFDASREGRPTVVCIRGESGVGKSSLVRAFGRIVRSESPALELYGRCYEREAVPFKAFDGIVDALGRHLTAESIRTTAGILPADAPLIARLFPTLRTVPLIASAIEPRLADPVEVRRRAFVALRKLLAALAARRSLVLTIDDFQWADTDSLALLGEILHPDEAPALLLITTVRSGADPKRVAEEQLTARCTRRVELRRIDLEPLPGEDAQLLARQLVQKTGLGEDVDAAAIAREAAGHPLFIHELISHMGLVGHNPGPALKLDDALWARISALEPPARRVLEVVAVAGAPIPRAALAIAVQALSSTPPAELQRWLSSLHTLRLLRTAGTRASDLVDSYHDRVRETVLAHAATDERRAIHAVLAAAFENVGMGAREPQLLVRHLQAAGDTGRAASYAERGAQVASDALAFDRAAELYKVALDLGTHTLEVQSRLRMQLGHALVNAGRGAEAADAYLAARDGALAATRLECQRRAAEQLLFSGQIERGQEVLSAVLADIDHTFPATPRAALLQVLWLRLRLKLRGYGWTRRDESEVAPTDLIRVDTFRTVGLGLSTVDNIRGAAFQGRALLAALDLGEEERIGQALCVQANYLASQGQPHFPVAKRLLADAKKIAVARNSAFLHAWVQAVTGTASFLVGDYATALTEIPASLKRFEEETVGLIWELNNARLFWLTALRQTGAYALAARLLDEWLRDAARRGDQYAETTLTRAGAIAWLMRDGESVVREALTRQEWTPPAEAYHLQHWYELRAWVDVELASGQRTDKRPLIEERTQGVSRSLLLRVQTVRAETWWMRGRLLLADALGEEEGRDARLSEVATLAHKLHKEGPGYARVWGLLLSGAVALQRGFPAECEADLRSAIEIADAQAMRACAAAARARLQHVSKEKDPGWADFVAAFVKAEGVGHMNNLVRVLTPGFPSAGQP
jgi:serine/threonine protein kinase